MTDEGIKSQALGSPEEKHLIDFGVSERFLEGVECELGPERRSEEEHDRQGWGGLSKDAGLDRAGGRPQMLKLQERTV